MMRYALIGLAALGLAACAAPSPNGGTPSPGPLAQIAAFTVADLQAADAEAVNGGDMIAHACFPALVTFIQTIPAANGSQTVAGAISAFEAARLLRMQVQSGVANGLPAYLKLGCSALVLDEQVLIAKLAALGAGAAVAAPILP
jgi:hypothetical protein